MDKGEVFGYIALGMLLIFGAYLTIQPHINPGMECLSCEESYPFPLHIDEWEHLAQGQQIMNTEKLLFKNPYSERRHRNLESGFHVFIAQFFTLTGLDPVLNHQFLPVIFALLLLLATVLLVYKISGSLYAGILSGLFMLSIKQNIYLLGYWFFLPVIFGILLMILFFHCYNDSRLKYVALIFYILTIFVHPLATIMLTLIIGLDWFIQKRIRPVHIIYIIPPAFLVLIYFKFKVWLILDSLIYRQSWAGIRLFHMSLFEFYGWIGIIFLAYGLYVWTRNKYPSRPVIWFMLSAALTLPLYMFNLTIITPYERAFLYLLFASAILSGVGMYFFLNWLSEKVKIRYARYGLLTVIMILFISMSFYNYNQIPYDSFKIIHTLDAQDYEAILWMRDNVRANSTVMVPTDILHTIYPLAYLKVPALKISNLGFGNVTKLHMYYFVNTSCADITYAMEAYKSEAYYTPRRLDCENMSLKYEQNGVFIYSLG